MVAEIHLPPSIVLQIGEDPLIQERIGLLKDSTETSGHRSLLSGHEIHPQIPCLAATSVQGRTRDQGISSSETRGVKEAASRRDGVRKRTPRQAAGVRRELNRPSVLKRNVNSGASHRASQWR